MIVQIFYHPDPQAQALGFHRAFRSGSPIFKSMDAGATSGAGTAKEKADP